jgi:hypothetical protein
MNPSAVDLGAEPGAWPQQSAGHPASFGTAGGAFTSRLGERPASVIAHSCSFL